MAYMVNSEDRLSVQEFINAVNSYPSATAAIDDGVGQTHTFPPEGEMYALWNGFVEARLADRYAQEVVAEQPDREAEMRRLVNERSFIVRKVSALFG